GGTAPGARNLISGNAGDGVVDAGRRAVIQGNYIGTDAAGTLAVGNGGGGVLLVGDEGTLVGGTATGARNLISGNAQAGVLVAGGHSGMVVQGNYIGTDATGTKALGNALDGVLVNGPNNTIGGTAAGARNLISGNKGHGVFIAAASSNVVQG